MRTHCAHRLGFKLVCHQLLPGVVPCKDYKLSQTCGMLSELQTDTSEPSSESEMMIRKINLELLVGAEIMGRKEHHGAVVI